jgi:predicted DNA-binding ribbon-helix-helix protein
MKSPKAKSFTVTPHSITIVGHGTSVSLEDGFWEAIKEIAKERGTSLGDLVASIEAERRGSNLSSAIRAFVIEHYQAQLAAHKRRVPSA